VGFIIATALIQVGGGALTLLGSTYWRQRLRCTCYRKKPGYRIIGRWSEELNYMGPD
jgi:hypothetical protein